MPFGGGRYGGGGGGGGGYGGGGGGFGGGGYDDHDGGVRYNVFLLPCRELQPLLVFCVSRHL